MSERSDEAIRLFKEGHNCAESVVGAFSEIFGIKKENAMKMVSGFGAGIGRMREVCGAMSGIVFIQGLKNGPDDPRDSNSKTKNYESVRALAEEFKKRNGGSIICRQLLGLEKMENSARPSDRTDEYYKKRPCVKIVEEAALIIEEMILD